jgi:hypothetical protein
MKTGPPPLPSRLPPPLPKGKQRKRSPFVACLTTSVILIVLVVGLGFLVKKRWDSQRARVEAWRASLPPVEITDSPYETLVGEGGSGSGFHFEWNGHRFIGCSLHQFDGRQPKEMISLDIDSNIQITDRVFSEGDVQVLTYESADLEDITPLRYGGLASLIKDMPAVLYHAGEAIHGNVVRISETEEESSFRPIVPFSPLGCSGAPIVNGKDGTVIGVALSADNIERPGRIGFQILRIPNSLKQSGPPSK